MTIPAYRLPEGVERGTPAHGSNTGIAPEAPATRFAKDQLKAIIERIERVEGEMKELSSDRTDIYKEAAGNGFDAKALRTIVRERKQDAAKRQEFEAIVDTYKMALGMLVDA